MRLKTSEYFIKPWNKESKMVFEQLMYRGKTKTKHTHIGSELSRRYPDFAHLGFLDWATTKHRKIPYKTLFQTADNVRMMPKKKGFFFYKIKEMF